MVGAVYACRNWPIMFSISWHGILLHYNKYMSVSGERETGTSQQNWQLSRCERGHTHTQRTRLNEDEKTMGKLNVCQFICGRWHAFCDRDCPPKQSYPWSVVVHFSHEYCQRFECQRRCVILWSVAHICGGHVMHWTRSMCAHIIARVLDFFFFHFVAHTF